MEEKEVVLTSVEQFKEYLKNTADDKTVISVVLELAGEDADKEGGEADGSLFALTHLLHQHGIGHNAERREDECDEQQARQWLKDGLMKPQSNDRCTEKEDDIQRKTHRDVEPENAVVVLLSRILQVDDGLCESTLLQTACYGSEDGEHANHTVVGRRQQPGKENAYNQVEHLRTAAVDGGPEQPAGSLLF